MDSEDRDAPNPQAVGREKHAYVTPFGRFVSQRQKSGAWAVGYQLQKVDDASGAVAEAIRNHADIASRQQHPSLATLYSADEVEQRLVWKLLNLPEIEPLSSLSVPQGSRKVEALIRCLAAAIEALHQAGLGAFDLCPELNFSDSGLCLAVLVPTLTLP